VSGRWFPGITPSRPAPVDLDTGVQYRTRDEFERFVAGLELVPPGIVPMAEWRAGDEPQPRPSPLEAGGYAAVARKD
jgi:S-adenosyl methyltransferase